MEVYRLVKQMYLSTALSGKRAATYGGRWNFVDIPAVYCAQSRSLAMLETLVHLGDIDNLPDDLVLLTISIPDVKAENYVTLDRCPDHWNALPFGYSSQEVFSNFYRSGKDISLAVPSVVVPEEYNILLNPHHPGMKDVAISSQRMVGWDNRLGT